MIEQIRQELTWKLRRDVLYPNETINEMRLEQDNDAIHFGAFKDGWLVGVVSLFQNDADFQFRKLAVDPTVQNTGIGGSLLQYITDYAVTERGKRIWCNARTTATNFYIKNGFNKTGQLFSKKGIDYEILEKLIGK